MQRRGFLQTSAKALGAAVFSGLAGVAEGGGPADLGFMERRPFGRTGHLRSTITFGGIVVMNEEQSLANRMVAEALEAGVNGFDVAPSYGDAELKLGEALKGKRDRVFLQCKTGRWDKAGAAEELRASLQRLQTDWVDLYQLHALSNLPDLDTIFGPGGAMEAFEEARQAGLIRFIGFSTHNPATALEALKRYDFASVMVPCNYVLHHYGRWGMDLIEEASRREIGILALKPIGARPWQEGEPRPYPKCWYRPFSTNHDIDLAMRYALSLPLTSAVPSGDVRLFRRCLQAARHWRPLTDADRAELERKAAELTPIFTC